MKQTAMILMLCLLVLLSACGAAGTQSGKLSETPPASQTQPPETAKPAPAEPAAATETPAPTEKPPEETPPTETEESAPVDEKLETAKTFVGKTTPELFAAIGEPDSSDYAPSCLGPGEDGNLYYESFTVYTYRENGMEKIRIVE